MAHSTMSKPSTKAFQKYPKGAFYARPRGTRRSLNLHICTYDRFASEKRNSAESMRGNLFSSKCKLITILSMIKLRIQLYCYPCIYSQGARLVKYSSNEWLLSNRHVEFILGFGYPEIPIQL